MLGLGCATGAGTTTSCESLILYSAVLSMGHPARCEESFSLEVGIRGPECVGEVLGYSLAIFGADSKRLYRRDNQYEIFAAHVFSPFVDFVFRERGDHNLSGNFSCITLG